MGYFLPKMVSTPRGLRQGDTTCCGCSLTRAQQLASGFPFLAPFAYVGEFTVLHVFAYRTFLSVSRTCCTLFMTMLQQATKGILVEQTLFHGYACL